MPWAKPLAGSALAQRGVSGHIPARARIRHRRAADRRRLGAARAVAAGAICSRGSGRPEAVAQTSSSEASTEAMPARQSLSITGVSLNVPPKSEQIGSVAQFMLACLPRAQGQDVPLTVVYARYKHGVRIRRLCGCRKCRLVRGTIQSSVRSRTPAHRKARQSDHCVMCSL